jgi:hypothetical protein
MHRADGGDDTPHFDGALDYERTGGFISERASVHIEPDGQMRRVKADGSTTTSTLSEATMTDLQAKVDQALFPMLATEYRCSCNDDFLHTITVEIGDTPYTVVADELADYPARLRPLIETLSSMSRAGLTGY